MTTTLSVEKMNLRITVVPIDRLKPHEKGSRIYLELLKHELLKDGILKYPIIADEKTHVILDGMHRWLALKILGHTLVPVMLVDAFQSPRIHVGKRRIHRYINDSNEQIAIGTVISAGLSGRLMNPRSTRHFFPFSKFQEINYPLRLLGRQEPQDVTPYIAKMTDEESNLVISDWLEEISEELEFLTKRREEVEKEMAELLNRVKSLDNGGPAF